MLLHRLICKSSRNGIKRFLRRVAEAFGISRWSCPARNRMDLRLLEYLGEEPGFFIEAGAHNGFAQSNTYYLARFKKWRGILVEAIGAQYQDCLRERKESRVYHNALVAEGFAGEFLELYNLSLMSQAVQTNPSGQQDKIRIARQLERDLGGERERVATCTLNDILAIEKPERIDLLSLDVEGGELDVLAGLDLKRYAPRVILVEANDPEGLKNYLLPRGYRVVEDFSGEDLLFLKTPSPEH